eukprot:6606356-Prymnesium_polylepis.1
MDSGAQLLAMAPAYGCGDVFAANAYASGREQAKTIAVNCLSAAAADFEPALTIVLKWHGAHVVVVLSRHCPSQHLVATEPLHLCVAHAQSEL